MMPYVQSYFQAALLGWLLVASKVLCFELRLVLPNSVPRIQFRIVFQGLLCNGNTVGNAHEQFVQLGSNDSFWDCQVQCRRAKALWVRVKDCPSL